MKKIYTFIYSAVLVAALVLSGCTEYEEVVDPPFVLPFDTIDAPGDQETSEILSFDSFTSYYEYSVESDVEWISIDKLGTVSWMIKISENETISPRETTLTVLTKDPTYGGATYSKTIHVSQSKGNPKASLDAPKIEFSADGGSDTFTLDTNLSNYTVSCDASWVTVGKVSNGKRIEISVKANPENYSRSAKLSIKGSGYTVDNVATITQQAMTYKWDVLETIDYTVVYGNEINLNVSPYGVETFKVGIRTNLSWKCEVYEHIGGTDWVTVHTPSCTVETKTEATTTEFEFSVAENRWGDRQVMLKVYAEKDVNKCTYIVVNQSYIPHLSFSEERITIGSSAKEHSVSFRAEANWYASCDADWLTLTRSSGGGNEDQLTFTVTENTTEPKRTATIKLGLTGTAWKKEVDEMTVVQTRDCILFYTQKEGADLPITLGSSEPFDVSIVENYYDPTTCEGYIIFTASPTKIGNEAFRGCSDLTSITIPDSVTSIEGYAFHNCSNLASITIPNSVTSIGNYAFYGCSSLPNITIPEGVTSIGYYAFSYCSSLTSITIPEGVTSIETSAFQSCYSLSSITIPDSVTSIGDSAFFYCSSLTNITIPNSVTSIGNYAFRDCRSLSNITIPERVTSIGDYTFAYCNSLATVNIPNSVTSIGYCAFDCCVNLTSITIPDSVTSIETKAFESCTSLTSVTIPEGVTSIESYTFAYCDNLAIVNIPNSVTSIGRFAFKECIKLTSVNIPYGVTTVGEYAFAECEALKDIIIPNSVTSIGESAFRSCDALTTVVVPDSVLSIGDIAFCDCNGLTSVIIGDGVTSIGENAFSSCDNLTSVTIGKSVASIGAKAFNDNKKLTSVYCKPTTPPTGGENMFSGYVTNYTIYVPTNSVEAYKEADYWSNYAWKIVGKEF